MSVSKGTKMNTNLQGTFRALADPTRRMILTHLSAKDMTIGEVADHFDMTRAAIKKHLIILEEGELISVHIKGRERINHLEPTALKSASEWFDFFSGFWDERLSRLQKAINKEKN